jgi:predicted GNAT family acetyltransferase
MAADCKLIDNKEHSRYEYHIGGHVAYVAYEEENGIVHLVRTSVPKALEGRGIAGLLVEDILEEIGKRGLKMKPECPYIIAYVKKHPEYQELLP